MRLTIVDAANLIYSKQKELDVDQIHRTTGIRKARIGDLEVEYTVSTLIGSRLSNTKGEFVDDSIYQKFFGTTPTLVDIVTGSDFDIIVASDHFSVTTNFNKLKEMF